MQIIDPWFQTDNAETFEVRGMSPPNLGILARLQDAVYVVDPSDRITLWNPSAEQLTGYHAKEVVFQKHGRELFTNAEQLEAEGKQGDVHPERSGIHSFARHKSGQVVPVTLRPSAIGDGQGGVAGLMVVFWDRTGEIPTGPDLGSQITELLQHYVSRETYEMARLNASGTPFLDSGPCEITAMFVDIVRFTAFAERSGPEAARRLLNEFFSLSEACVLNHRGDIDKLIGDCIMAIFHTADDAVAAGHDLLQVFATRNERIRDSEGPELHVRIGIHSGQAIRGDVGGPSRRDCTVVGDAVNTAARLQCIGDIDAILISESTYLQLNNQAGFEFIGTTRIRGKADSLRLYIG